jgi:hypothetical protein
MNTLHAKSGLANQGQSRLIKANQVIIYHLSFIIHHLLSLPCPASAKKIIEHFSASLSN